MRTAPGTIKIVGAQTDYVPRLCPEFFFCDFFMPEKKHNRATREKQATVKLVISTATITRESNIISTGRFREVWLNFYFFLSVGKLVMSLFTINICLPIGGI